MRFSETLRFNANPEWWVYYIPYDELKAQISELRRLHNALFFTTHSSPRSSPRTSNTRSSSHHVEDSSEDEDVEHGPPQSPPTFTIAPRMLRSASQKVLADLDRPETTVGYGGALGGRLRRRNERAGVVPDENLSEHEVRAMFEEEDAHFFEKLRKSSQDIDEFFKRLSLELTHINSELRTDSRGFLSKSAEFTSSSEVRPLLGVSRPNDGVLRAVTEAEKEALRRRLVDHYKELGETVNYSTLNRNGFDKILKKHDKVTSRSTRASFMANLISSTTFTDPGELQVMQTHTEQAYADIFKGGDFRAGKEELRDSLRDLIIWDRNTIWRDLLRTERRVGHVRTMRGGEDVDISRAGDVLFRPKLWVLALATALFLFLSMFPGIVKHLTVDDSTYSPEALDAAHRCLALTAFVIVLWAFEGLPLYVTSFLVLPGVVMLRVFLDDNGNPFGPQDASKAVFMSLSSPTIVLIICVYSLGAALSKFEIDKLMATSLLSRVHRADRLLLALMFLAVVVSMFVSNVAAPVLLNSVMMPTFDAMRNSESDKGFVRCLLFGIMVGSNIGGFASPISSPQSAVALGLLVGDDKISFTKWLLAALPQCAVMVFLSYLLLQHIYKPGQYELPPLPRTSEKLGWPHWVVMGTVSVTVLLWSVHSLSDGFGSPGIVAALPIIIFFGMGILNKEDFNNLPWDVVYLVAGGIVLGAAVESCKLLDLVAGKLNETIGGQNVYMTYFIFCLFMAAVANAVSHTVSAIIVLPLIMKVGVALGHAQLLVLSGTFAASSAMALPISSFPNISATQVEDEKGEPFISPLDIVKIGAPMTGIAVVVLLTFGYVLMISLGM